MNIQLCHSTVYPDLPYMANINGISKGSITCYFNAEGDLMRHTINPYSPKAETLIAELKACVEASVLVFPEHRVMI